ncbi:uncharacterized protein NEMAJ01_2331 [Nematocida major]|uniref:uncharacterized protein n=1 Tax=Nematocida major TaxID=1912982 RepID=UPI002008A15C|nr:uncharacterized protein NEMAJ01_2331 [Nematocida major]KAH9387435.1 hypothetical protein NEMAJ01_2331 [Nematocida major]
MDKIKHIRVDSDLLRQLVFRDIEDPEIIASTNPVLTESCSRVKRELKNIPEEKRAEVHALVDEFLQENLKLLFRKIAKDNCVVSPELVEMFTKEVIAELPSELVHGISVICTKIIDPYQIEKDVKYKNFSIPNLRKRIELFKSFEETQKLVILQSEKIIQRKSMEHFDKPQFEAWLSKDKNRLEYFTTNINDLLKKEEEMIKEKEKEKKEKEKEKCIEENSLDLEKYTLDRIVEKAKGYYSGDKFNPSLYFGLKRVTEENKKNIIDYITEIMPDPNDSPSEAEKKEDRKNYLYRISPLYDFFLDLYGPVDYVLEGSSEFFKSIINMKAASKLIDLAWRAKSKINELEGPEKAEMEELFADLVKFNRKMSIIVYTFFAKQYRIHDAFRIADSPLNMLSAWSREEFGFFTNDFKKMMARLPTMERNSGFEKAFHALMSCAYEKNERARQLHRNAMRAEECLEGLQMYKSRRSDDKYGFGVREYEKFAKENPAPVFSGSIEDIPPESLDDGVTPREIQTTILSLKIFHDMYTEELKDETKSDSEKEVLRGKISETEEKIRVLEEKLLSFADLTEEEAKKNDCLRFVYLQEYRYQCLSRIDTLKTEAEEEIIPLAKEVMREIEKIPNNPEFNKKVEKMLEDLIEEEPHCLLTPKFIFVNMPFFMEGLPNLIYQLDEEIAKVVGGSSAEKIE